MAGSAAAETKSLHVPAAYGEPPDGWTWSRLDDVSEGVFDCPHSTPKLTDTGPFVVRTFVDAVVLVRAIALFPVR